jgi:hypothetical protein
MQGSDEEHNITDKKENYFLFLFCRKKKTIFLNIKILYDALLAGVMVA